MTARRGLAADAVRGAVTLPPRALPVALPPLYWHEPEVRPLPLVRDVYGPGQPMLLPPWMVPELEAAARRGNPVAVDVLARLDWPGYVPPGDAGRRDDPVPKLSS